MTNRHTMLGTTAVAGDYCPETGYWRQGTSSITTFITQGHRIPQTDDGNDVWTLILYA
ncbi:hypothetical protein [Sphingomonas sp. Leaf10]|uniref:hypothetical protein n=1 Tax=Sphingomonas sp. Leaf10 TaxID=1735676 RepID=UPI000A944914|nr:hypothetical protein [Sphingomonas sp. Leaf10]